MNQHEQPLIKNLVAQLSRMNRELVDLETTKDELSQGEYDEMKEEFLDQMKEFGETLDRLNKGDLTVTNKISVIKNDLRKTIASSFNTLEMIKIFGVKSSDELAKQLASVDEEYKLKRINTEEMETRKLEILNKLRQHDEKLLSAADLKFLDDKNQQMLQQLDEIKDE
ncbi:unnamed protein product [Diamesa serratosioi]